MIRRYSFSQHFIDPERCFVSINKLENLPRTDKQTDRQTENSITEATLIPCGLSGGADQYLLFLTNFIGYSSFFSDFFSHFGKNSNYSFTARLGHSQAFLGGGLMPSP